MLTSKIDCCCPWIIDSKTNTLSVHVDIVISTRTTVYFNIVPFIYRKIQKKKQQTLHFCLGQVTNAAFFHLDKKNSLRIDVSVFFPFAFNFL